MLIYPLAISTRTVREVLDEILAAGLRPVFRYLDGAPVLVGLPQ